VQHGVYAMGDNGTAFTKRDAIRFNPHPTLIGNRINACADYVCSSGSRESRLQPVVPEVASLRRAALVSPGRQYSCKGDSWQE
jgi:hypothetical protein